MKYLKKYTQEIILAFLFILMAILFIFAERDIKKPYKEIKIKSSGWR